MGDATNKEDGEDTPKKINVLVYFERLFQTLVMDFILAILMCPNKLTLKGHSP